MLPVRPNHRRSFTELPILRRAVGGGSSPNASRGGCNSALTTSLTREKIGEPFSSRS
jgi:hypothetical protein